MYMKTPTHHRLLTGTVLAATLLIHGRADPCAGTPFPCCTQKDFPLVDHEVELAGSDGRVFYVHQKYAGANRTEVVEGSAEVELQPGRHWINVRLTTGTGPLCWDFWSPTFCPESRLLDAQLRVAILLDAPVASAVEEPALNRAVTTLRNGLGDFRATCQKWLPDGLATGTDSSPIHSFSSRSATGFSGAPSCMASANGFTSIQPQVITAQQSATTLASPNALSDLFCWGMTVAGDAGASLTNFAFNVSAPVRCRILTSFSRAALNTQGGGLPYDRISALQGPSAIRRDSLTGAPVAFEFHEAGWVVPPVKAYGYRFVATGQSDFLGGTLPAGFKGLLTIKVGGIEFARLAPGSAFSFAALQHVREFTVDGFQMEPGDGTLAIPAFWMSVVWPPGDQQFEIQPRHVPEPVIYSPSPESMTLGADVTLHAATFPATPASYQWAFNGRNIDGETNLTLNLKNLAAAHSGTYTVTASNDVGSISSQPLALKITTDLLKFTNQRGGPVLSWNAASAILETAPTPGGPWQSVPEASTPWTLPPNQVSSYFRLRF